MTIAANMPSELRSAQVVLRRFNVGDITDSYIGWLNDSEVVRFSNQRFRAHDRESCQRYLFTFEGAENLFLSIADAETGRAIGTMTVYVSLPHNTADMGIMVGDPAVWGRGFGQAAWSMMADWLLESGGVRKLTAGALACNVGMIRLMERSGMQHEATRHAQEIVEGRAEDILYYARFRNL